MHYEPKRGFVVPAAQDYAQDPPSVRDHDELPVLKFLLKRPLVLAFLAGVFVSGSRT